MPFSIVMQGYPTDNAPVPHVQGATVQGMFLQLFEEVDPTMADRLHDDSKYRRAYIILRSPFFITPRR